MKKKDVAKKMKFEPKHMKGRVGRHVSQKTYDTEGKNQKNMGEKMMLGKKGSNRA